MSRLTDQGLAPPTFLSNSHTPSQYSPCPNQLRAGYQTTRDHHAYSPKPAEIIQTNQSYTVYFSLSCLSHRDPNKGCGLCLPLASASSSWPKLSVPPVLCGELCLLFLGRPWVTLNFFQWYGALHVITSSLYKLRHMHRTAGIFAKTGLSRDEHGRSNSGWVEKAQRSLTNIGQGHCLCHPRTPLQTSPRMCFLAFKLKNQQG